MPAKLTFETLSVILDEIARQERQWQGFSLHVNLGDAHLPDVGYVAVPVVLHVEAKKAETQRRAIVVAAARHAEAFPVFRGFLEVEETGPRGSSLRLEGSYNLPMQGFGTLLDAAAFGGVARRSLENFLQDLERATRARIEKAEAEIVRYSLFQHGW